MKKISLILLIPLFITACMDLESESYSRYTSYVDVNKVILPDSAVAGQDVSIYAQAMAPNGCWSDLAIFMRKSGIADTVYGITATGLFESHDNICPDVVISHDTTFTFHPDSAGTYIFISYSAALLATYDTLFVTEPEPGN